ncbi:unnamed protein product [Closterium sp. NIES-64]|nr:unnamed protein product [Closterium sp. NIES-64]
MMGSGVVAKYFPCPYTVHRLLTPPSRSAPPCFCSILLLPLAVSHCTPLVSPLHVSGFSPFAASVPSLPTLFTLCPPLCLGLHWASPWPLMLLSLPWELPWPPFHLLTPFPCCPFPFSTPATVCGLRPSNGRAHAVVLSVCKPPCLFLDPSPLMAFPSLPSPLPLPAALLPPSVPNFSPQPP